jgi:hypothetical protein
MIFQILPNFDGNIEEYGPICQVFPTISKKARFLANWITSLRKSRFVTPRQHPEKIGPAGQFSRASPSRGLRPLSPAESEIRPANQTEKLSTGLMLYSTVEYGRVRESTGEYGRVRESTGVCSRVW